MDKSYIELCDDLDNLSQSIEPLSKSDRATLKLASKKFKMLIPRAEIKIRKRLLDNGSIGKYYNGLN